MTQHNTPWAILKVSRKQYATVSLWKTAGMSRERFEDMLSILSEGMMDQIQLEADAERLPAALDLRKDARLRSLSGTSNQRSANPGKLKLCTQGIDRFQ